MKTNKRKNVRRELIEIWATMPDSVRVDVTRKVEGTDTTRTDIFDGEQQLRRTCNGDVEVQPVEERRERLDENLPTEYRRHFGPGLIREFFRDLYLEEIGKTEVAGRECIRIRGVPVPGDMLWPHWLSKSVDELNFSADLTRPALLSIHAFLNGKTIEKYEVAEIEYDKPIEASVFTCEPMAGGTVKTAQQIFEQVTLEAAVDRVPFTVLCPAKSVDARWNLQVVHYHFARGKDPEHLTLHFFPSNLTDDKTLWMRLEAGEDDEEHRDLEWEKIRLDGRLFKLSDPGTPSGTRILVFEQDGTHASIYSSGARSDLLDFAVSLEAVS